MERKIKVDTGGKTWAPYSPGISVKDHIWLSGQIGVDSGDTIELPSEKIGPISEIRYKDISSSTQSELVEAIMEEINNTPDNHLSFYNRANNISLKVHSFQLLPSIGKSKAQQMVQSRGMIGWENFTDIDEKCSIDSVRLLAERYVIEMEDSIQVPRLLDLLIRTGV